MKEKKSIPLKRHRPSRTVRHAACSLLYYCEPDNPPEGVLRKQILVRTLAHGLPATRFAAGLRLCVLNLADGQERGENLAGLQRSDQSRHLPAPGGQGRRCNKRKKRKGEQVRSVCFSLLLVLALSPPRALRRCTADWPPEAKTRLPSLRPRRTWRRSCFESSPARRSRWAVAHTWRSTPPRWMFVLVIFGS